MIVLSSLLSRLFGIFASIYWPFPLNLIVVGGFAVSMGISCKESQKSLSQFRRIQDLFTRSLIPSARPYHDAALTSPCDGAIQEVGTISDAQVLCVKGQNYALKDLAQVDDTSFVSGSFITLYLSPKDCHQYFMPCDTIVKTVTHIPGACYPVHPWLESKVPTLFLHNERVILECQSGNQRWLMILVAALNVGKIIIDGCPQLQSNQLKKSDPVSYELNKAFKQGEKCGQFMLGSTIVMCFDQQSSYTPAVKNGQSIRYLEPLFNTRSKTEKL